MDLPLGSVVVIAVVVEAVVVVVVLVVIASKYLIRPEVFITLIIFLPALLWNHPIRCSLAARLNSEAPPLIELTQRL